MLRLDNVQKTFVQPDGSPLPILKIERFELRQGEQAALMGRSGSGKTTLLHAIAGITRVDSGRIEVDGVDIVALGEAVRDRFRAHKIGYVFQTFNLLPGFSAIENVLLGMAFASGRPDVARAGALLDRVGLKHRLQHRPSTLSVGEQQRVAIARSLANRPKLLLADEPTANVDQSRQQQLIDLIRNACRDEQVSLLLVTHTPEVADQFDRVDQLADFNKAMAS